MPVLPPEHAMVLSMIAGGAPIGEAMTALARVVETHEHARCAILGRDHAGDLFVVAAPSLPPAWHDEMNRGGDSSAKTREGADPAWLCHPTVVQYVEASPADVYPARGTNEDLHVCVTVPIFVDGHATGAVAVYYQAPHSPAGTETARLSGYAQLAAVAMARAKAEHQLRLRMSLDATTGLPNATDAAARVDAALERRRHTPGAIVAVMTADVPRLHEYNTTFGFGAGDDVLRFVAGALSDTVGRNGTVVRTGGGRFLLIVEGLSRPEDIVDLAYQARTASSGPVMIGAHPVLLEPVVGVAVAEHGEATAEQLLAEAHAAVAPEHAQDGVVVFDPAVARRASDRLLVELGLHRALAHDELALYYQPIWSIEDERLVGVEALVRWHDPEFGLRPPADFIGIAEDSGMIRELTGWVIDTACRQIAQWLERDPGFGLHVSVNVSAAELSDDALIADVARALHNTGIPPNLLCLELTETAVMTDAGAALDVLGSLKSLGVELAIDDFGTGYSSLAYLRRLPVDYLKIDRSFIATMSRSPEDRAIVAMVAGLATTLGLRLVAEGVETAEDVATLRTMTCALGQGFHWSPAVTAAEIDRLLQHAA